jgi:hypothetical protein
LHNKFLRSKLNCIDNDITRKNKDGAVFASLGTGILQYLKSQLLSTSPNSVVSTIISTGLTKAEVLELIAESNTNLSPSSVLSFYAFKLH